jgi:hypothetical protein
MKTILLSVIVGALASAQTPQTCQSTTILTTPSAVTITCNLAPPVVPAITGPAPTGLPPLPASVVVPTLPQNFMTVVYPTGLTVVPVHAGANLQTALNAAQCGQNLVLDAGVTWSGNFNVPGPPCPTNNPILVSSSAMAQLPGGNAASTQQIQLSQAPLTATLSSPNVNQALGFCQLPPGGTCTSVPANCYFAGLSFTTSNVGNASSPNYNIVAISVGATAMAQEAQHIVFDRVIVQGNGMTTRGFYADAQGFALINSQVVGMIDTSQDTQAVLGCDSTGPFLIQGNHLEASGENIMFGGCGTGLLPPSDITVRRNYLHKQPSWYGQLFNGLLLDIKNNFECKDCVRVLVDSNIGDYSVAQGQGNMLSNNSFTPWHDQDITYSNNLLQHAGGGPYVASNDQTVAANTARVLFRNNLFLDVNTSWGGGNPSAPDCFVISGGTPAAGGMQNITFDHNTCLNSVTAPGTENINESYWNGKANIAIIQGLTVTNNIGYGAMAVDGSAQGGSLALLPSTGIYLNNMQVGDTWASTPIYPLADHVFQPISTATPAGGTHACNTQPLQDACQALNWAMVGMVDYPGAAAGTDLPGLALLSTSLYHLAGSDGADLGANVAAVLAAVAGVQ